MYKTNKELSALIDNLLERGKEGNYWDFKKEWPEKNADLLKDIICFANTVHDYDCYLIYGINDNLEVTGIENTSKRYTQANIIDAISNIHFAGDISPKIELEELMYMGHTLDILIVKNIVNTPIYLNTPYGEMLQGCVYSREGDKNTPNKGNADNQTIEYLWRKRLGLTQSKTEYFYSILENKEEWNWKDSYFYYIYKPEFTIEIDNRINDTDQFYFHVMINENGHFQNLSLKYQNTILDSYEIAILDSSNIRIPVPDFGFMYSDSGHNNNIGYRFYIENTPRFILLNFLYNWENPDERNALKRLKNVVLIYNTINEQKEFEQFIKKNYERVVDDISKCDEFKFVNTGDENKTKLYKTRLNTGHTLKKLLEEWRRRSKSKS